MEKLFRAIFSIIISVILCTAIDLIATVCGFHLPVLPAVFIFLVLFSVFYFVKRIGTKLIVVLSAAFSLCFLISAILLISFKKTSQYNSIDDGKVSLYSSKKVMLVIPHQDDDLSLLGGVIEEFIKYGSEVRIVFTTNGDSYVPAGTRLAEALNVAADLKISASDVIFLGYGDGTLFVDQSNIYNSAPNSIYTSHAGFTNTYALSDHPAYNDGNPYTRSNYLKDLENVIMEYKPDTIFCVDYDLHPDHRATSLFFDEAIGNILSSQSSYKPMVFKSFAYSYTFYGFPDFYDSINLLSSRKTYYSEYLPESNVFNWSDRIRFPINAATISRSIYKCDLFRQESMYASQNAVSQVSRVINGDRVFWLRRTDSLSYNAAFSVSSGNNKLLNDFKIIDSSRVWDKDAMPFDGVWVPEPDDSIKTVDIDLPSPADIHSITLYDSPSLDDNIKNVEITFNNGNKYTSGELCSNGSATVIPVDEKNVSHFSISIKDFEGTAAGLSEIEFYSSDSSPLESMPFIKLMDSDENFVYDYYTEPSGYASFSLYSPVGSTDLSSYVITCDNERCTFETVNNSINVYCPKFSACTLKIQSEDSALSDSVYISNPGIIRRAAWNIDKFYYTNADAIGSTLAFSILNSIRK